LSKEQVRRLAVQYDLPVAHQAESQEICFIPDDDYRQFLRERVPEKILPGPILSTTGLEIGRHHGLPFYTIGQRKGLGIAAPEPLYVVALDSERNVVITGPLSELGRNVAQVEKVSYVSGRPLVDPFAATVKIRYQAKEADATVIPGSASSATVRFAHSMRDITPGQGIVFYRDEMVIGGGIITASERDSSVVTQ
jgi:tRNA-uridine 2-sulfurtransferase